MGAGSSGVLKKEEVSKFWSVSKKVLGKGSFATVRKATKLDKDDVARADFPQEVAAKIIDKGTCTNEDLPLLKDEVDIMLKIKDKGCVQLYEMFESENHLILMVELCNGGELFDRISQKEKYGEAEAADVIRQVAEALKYLHDHNIVHRDLKPENLIYKEENGNILKLTDFGLAKYIEPNTASNMMETACGTPSYVAPEVIQTTPMYGPKVDMWSLGVIGYILLCGFQPFYAEDDNLLELFHVIKAAEYEFLSPYWDNVSDTAKDLISKLLVVDPEERYSAEQVLSHPWIADKTKQKEGSLGSHIQDGIGNICAKTKWKKAQARIKVMRTIGKIVKASKLSKAEEIKSNENATDLKAEVVSG
jgi:calcium/calmodulin-dependent protein kinase I